MPTIGAKNKGITFRKTIGDVCLSSQDLDRVETLLVRLIADAYIRDNPLLFENPSNNTSGPPAAAAAVSGAPLASAGGPEERRETIWSMEHDGGTQRRGEE